MKIRKTIIAYLFFTIGVFIFNKIYAIFGHGVSSHWMSNAYLYLLGLGVGAFAGIEIFTPSIEQDERFPLFYNTYNTGVAILINGMLLLGIIEIAGGTSPFAMWYLYIGYGVIAAAIAIFIFIILQNLVMQRK
jgi:hypothetical protein